MLSSFAHWLVVQSLRRWLSANTVLVFTCRIQLINQSTDHTLKFHHISRNQLYSDAEQAAQRELLAELQARSLSPEVNCRLKWNKGRIIGPQTIRNESDIFIRLTNDLRKSGGTALSNLDESNASSELNASVAA